jgi:hypothetical protein
MAPFGFWLGRRFGSGSLRCAGAEESQSSQPETTHGLATKGYRYQVITGSVIVALSHFPEARLDRFRVANDPAQRKEATAGRTLVLPI